MGRESLPVRPCIPLSRLGSCSVPYRDESQFTSQAANYCPDPGDLEIIWLVEELLSLAWKDYSLPSAAEPADAPKRPAAKPPRMVTLLIQDVRSGTTDHQLAEVKVQLKAADDPQDGFWADAKELVGVSLLKDHNNTLTMHTEREAARKSFQDRRFVDQLVYV